MARRKTTTIKKAAFRWITLPALAMWLISMALLTWAAAKDFYRQMDRNALEWALDSASSLAEPQPSSGEALYYVRMAYSVHQGYTMMRAEPLLPIMLPQTKDAPISHDDWWNYIGWDQYYGCQLAIAYYDTQGEPVFISGNHIIFSYKPDKSATYENMAYIDMSDFQGGNKFADRYFTDTDPTFGESLFSTVEMTGWFEGDRFHPTRIVNRENGDIHYDVPAPSDRALVTVSPEYMIGYNYTPGSAFRFDRQTYESPTELLGQNIKSGFHLRSAAIRYPFTYCGGTGEVVVWCNPLKYAVLRLIPAYLVSLLLVVTCLVLLRRRLRRKLTEPMEVICIDLENNQSQISEYPHSPFGELQTLTDQVNNAQRARHEARTEVNRLNVALDYARNAEENRRRMTSAIAHELKTPLAVIHSYAEGLQTGIAQEKTDKYLSVILDETEQMDDLVLQMLELSRLEAGKVRLQTEGFSLETMTQSIFEKLSLALEAKQLQLSLRFGSGTAVTADPLRIQQVITNFATNAIKYTPQGGNIWVHAFCDRGQAHFRIANDCTPLSQEQLDRIWDSFYRADDARSGDGTGLGLAIAKNIITLHGGSCSAEKTKTGVEFRFQIPC